MNLTTKDVRLAVLIDADNVSPHHIQNMMEEVARYGNPTIKRIYGDWTRPHLAKWKSQLLDYAISPVQQFGYTTGKNATDSAMIIDAMDILYDDRVDGFVLVSSDSDFTKLATRLREAGKIVYGLGEMKTPNAFIAACDRFIFLEVIEQRSSEEADDDGEKLSPSASKSKAASDIAGLQDAKKSSAKKGEDKDTVSPGSKGFLKINRKVINLITNSIRDVEDDDGWSFLADVGNMLVKRQPSFDARNYGYDKLTTMIRSIENFDVQFRETSNPNIKLVYIRVRNGKK
ncbi:MAG TPA: NYN domain-containing protein [Bacillota bacterium]|nr:NYN domain-containing protein [Bacillota bacterium]